MKSQLLLNVNVFNIYKIDLNELYGRFMVNINDEYHQKIMAETNTVFKDDLTEEFIEEWGSKIGKLEVTIEKKRSMIDDYFGRYEVKRNFQKEFVSIFEGWLGEANLYKLDEVTENEWSSFNIFIKQLFEKYDLYLANPIERSCEKITNIDAVISSYEESMEKSSDDFTKIVIPELDVVLLFGTKRSIH